MAILARAMVTLASIKDVASVTRFYRLLSSTASKPSVPTTNPPDSSWSTTEPTYSEETTSTLYFVDLTVFSDGSYVYSDVSQSTSYEAAKSAYNVAQNAKDVADSVQDSIDSLSFGARNLLYNSSFSKNFNKWGKNARYEFVTEDGYPCGHISGGTGAYAVNQAILERIKDDEADQIYTASGDIKLVNYADNTGSTTPYLSFYLTGHYLDDSGDSKWIGATRVGGTVGESTQRQFVPFSGQGWVRVNYVFKFAKKPSEMTDMAFDIYTRNWSGDLYFKNLKLERGNKATDWSPAPEDIDESINSVVIESTSDNFINYTFDGSKIYYPSTITLTPFINGNIEFSKWQYKLINGDTWIDVVSGSNGLTIESDNTLIISNSCSLFTDTCSAIVFKCLSDNNTFYSSKTIVREDDPTRVYNTVKTRVDQTDDNLSLIASATELAEYSTSSTLNSRLANVSVSSDEILMIVSQSVNNLSTANGIKGVYDEAISYATNNIVVLNGKFYKAKKASTGKTPPNTTYWTDVTSQYSETTLKTAFSKIVALQDSITLQVSGSNGNSAINLTDGTLSLTVTDVANILADKELNLTSQNGVINIYGGGGVNIGTNTLGSLTVYSPNFKLTNSGYMVASRGTIGNWEINENELSSFKIFDTNNDEYTFNNPWISGYYYRDGDQVNLYTFSNDYSSYTRTHMTCVQDHISSSNKLGSAYWSSGIIDEVTIEGVLYNTIIDSYNSKIDLIRRNVTGNIDEQSYDETILNANGLEVDSLTGESIFHSNGINHTKLDNDDFSISSTGDIVLNNISLGNTSISSIGNGSITGAISNLNSSKSNLLSKTTYTTSDESIAASAINEISINVATNNKTPIGIIECAAFGSASACLTAFWFDNSTTVKVRIKNLSTGSIQCHARATILYVNN